MFSTLAKNVLESEADTKIVSVTFSLPAKCFRDETVSTVVLIPWSATVINLDVLCSTQTGYDEYSIQAAMTRFNLQSGGRTLGVASEK